VTVGEQRLRAIEIIGEPDPDSDAFLARSFDSEGKFETMRLRIDDDGVRSTLTVSGDRASMKAFWERSEDGINWEPWMDMTFTRSE
jgi:hypothetical protein